MNEFNLTSSNNSHINKNLLKTFTKIEDKEIFENIFQPKFVDIIIRIDKLEEDIEKYNQKIINEINVLTNNLYSHQNYQKRSDVIDIVFKILKIKSNQNNIKSLNTQDIHENLRKENEITSKYSSNKINYFEFKTEYQNLNFPQPQYRDSIPKHITFCKLEINNISNEMIDFIWKLPDIAFQINIRNEKNMNFDYLSYGEKNLLTILSCFINLAENNTHKQWGTKVDEVEDSDTGEKFELENDILYDEIINHKFFLIDEYELGIHPNWQKEILYKLINFFKNYANSIHLIFTTHSPFLLSDLPKGNVVFLEKNAKTGDCTNVTKDIDINPFGANIHTLLSHGFFMSDGLMGEFAKGKIEEIKKFYELFKKWEEKIKENKRPYIYIKLIYLIKIKQFRHIQSIIGEPFLQTVIKNYLDELEIIFSGKKEFLDNEILRLQNLRNQIDD